MLDRKKLCVILLVVCSAVKVYPSADVMKTLSQNYVKALNECKKELDLPQAALNDFYQFWNEEHTLSHRETGCVIMCLSTKLDLVDPDGNLHHGNAKDFATKHGADDSMAAQLVTMIHECEKETPDNPDQCLKVLGVANCFTTKIHALKWAPSVDVIMAEVLADV